MGTQDEFLIKATEKITASLMELTLIELVKDEMNTDRSKEAVALVAREVREVTLSGKEPSELYKSKLIAAAAIDIINRCSATLEVILDKKENTRKNG